MYKLGLRSEVELTEVKGKAQRKMQLHPVQQTELKWKKRTYKLVPTSDPSFIEGMVANLVITCPEGICILESSTVFDIK